MSPMLLTAYVLVWPVIVAGVLLFLLRSFFSEWAEARRENRPII
ncbi:putative transporter small subunit [Bacillus subtilis]|nr:putative transporter small subunit [Pseudochrobactrum asaccharolyticum]MCF7672686.1 putative transporter small subunit [Bacillus subtilis]